jgi:hypothetical protein
VRTSLRAAVKRAQTDKSDSHVAVIISNNVPEYTDRTSD